MERPAQSAERVRNGVVRGFRFTSMAAVRGFSSGGIVPLAHVAGAEKLQSDAAINQKAGVAWLAKSLLETAWLNRNHNQSDRA